MTKVNLAIHVAPAGGVGLATLTTSAGEIDIALVFLVWVAVSTTRASAIVFHNDESPLTIKTFLLNLVHMLSLTVMAFGVTQLAAALGWQMSLGTILLTGGTFGWEGPRIHRIVSELWFNLLKALFNRPPESK